MILALNSGNDLIFSWVSGKEFYMTVTQDLNERSRLFVKLAQGTLCFDLSVTIIIFSVS